jgi:hypothetical protein
MKDSTVKYVQCVCIGGSTSVTGEFEWRKLKWGYMDDGLHTLIWNETKRPLAITSSGAGRGLRGREHGGDLTYIQYKPNQNCHYESPPLYNEQILIKNFIIKKTKKIYLVPVCPFIAVLFTIAKTWNQSKCLSTNDLLMKT